MCVLCWKLYVFLALISLICLNNVVQAQNPIWIYEPGTEITDISLSPDIPGIIAGGERIHSISKNGDLLWKQWYGTKVDTSSDGKFIAFFDGHSLCLLNNDSGSFRIFENTALLQDFALSPDGTRIITGNFIGEVNFFDNLGHLIIHTDTRGNTDDYDYRSNIGQIVISGDGRYAAVISDRGLFYYTIYGKKQWSREGLLEGEGGSHVALSFDGNEIVTANEHKIRYFTGKGDLIWEYKIGKTVTAISISSDGSSIIAGARDNTIYYFDRNGQKIWTYETGFWIRDVAISSNGSYALAGSMDDTIYAFNRNGTLIWNYKADDWIEDVAITPEGSFCAASTKYQVFGFEINFTPINQEILIGTPLPTQDIILSVQENSTTNHIPTNTFSSIKFPENIPIIRYFYQLILQRKIQYLSLFSIIIAFIWRRMRK
jgi:WD40 repeat protein